MSAGLKLGQENGPGCCMAVTWPCKLSLTTTRDVSMRKGGCMDEPCPYMASPAHPVIVSSSPPDELPENHDYSKGVKHLVDNARDLRSIPPRYVLPISPLPVSNASVPVIDLYGLNGPDPIRMQTIQSISLACAQWGFFRIINHGVRASLMEDMLKSVEGFFSLPVDEKLKYASNDVMNPVRYGTSLNTSSPHALHWRDYLRHFARPTEKYFHLWPENPPNYRQVAKEYLEEVWKIGLKLVGAISEGLGLKQCYIGETLGEGSQIIAANYYPPCPSPDRTLGLCPHSDHGGLTILMQNEVDGLQVKHEGMWVPVHYVPGSFVVNIGDYLEILSNGRYKSVEHRAVVNEKRTRISIAVGLSPELDAIVAPASQLVNEKTSAKYRPIVYREYMRCQQSSVERGKSPLQAIMIETSSMPTDDTSSTL